MKKIILLTLLLVVKVHFAIVGIKYIENQLSPLFFDMNEPAKQTEIPKIFSAGISDIQIDRWKKILDTDEKKLAQAINELNNATQKLELKNKINVMNPDVSLKVMSTLRGISLDLVSVVKIARVTKGKGQTAAIEKIKQRIEGLRPVIDNQFAKLKTIHEQLIIDDAPPVVVGLAEDAMGAMQILPRLADGLKKVADYIEFYIGKLKSEDYVSQRKK